MPLPEFLLEYAEAIEDAKEQKKLMEKQQEKMKRRKRG